MTAAPASVDYNRPCAVRNWLVFANGLNRGELYSPAEVDEIARNHPLISRYMTPRVGTGHDKQQRLSASLGLPSNGDVTAVRSDGRGGLYLDLDNIPGYLGAQINAGRYPSGSVELKRDFQPPDDPAHPIPGRYLDGIALLGEEQPAVKGCPPPRAVWPDGTEVPPSWEPIRFTPGPLSPPQPVTGSHSALCFSEAYAETPPVTPEQIVEALKALPPEQQQAVIAQVQAQPPTPATPPPDPAVAAAKPEGFSAPADAPPWAKQMSESFATSCKKMSDDYSDLSKRFSAMEALTTTEQKKSDADQMAAFSDSFDAIFTRNDNGRRVQPVSREAMKKLALDTFKAKVFSADKTPSAFLADIEAQIGLLPIDPRMAQIPVVKQGGQTAAHNPILAEMVRPGSALDRWAPKVAAAHRN
jgi:hypothetical protein